MHVLHDPGTPAPQGRSHLKGQTGAVAESDTLPTVNKPIMAGRWPAGGEEDPSWPIWVWSHAESKPVTRHYSEL